ncbi:MAG: DNA repair protein RecO [Anaerolineales bacterium]|jgi:DNA repair protein RecO (recombination protein O)
MQDRERLYRAEGVVLRHMNLGEADRLLTIYTREHGKLRQIAKGVRRPQSKKAGHLNLFSRVSILAARGRELDVITQVEALDTYVGLRSDLDLVGRAAYAIELVDQFTVDGEASSGLYSLLTSTLERLSTGVDRISALRHFELRLLDYVGYRPELFRCNRCGVDIRPEDQFFSYETGGVLCPKCGPDEPYTRPISLASLKVLRHFQRSSYEHASQAKIRPAVHKELDRLMEGFFNYLLERRLNSPGFLRRLRQIGRRKATSGAEIDTQEKE